MGVKGLLEFNIDTSNEYKEILLVSCSELVPVKRVHLIIDILRHIETPLRWVHFGDGRLMPELKTRVKELPDNINYELRGYVPNQGVLEFYQKNEVDLFVNVSESEGIPVSIMEAISFGIPILATDVGGVHEIVTDKTGVLVDKTFKPKRGDR